MESDVLPKYGFTQAIASESGFEIGPCQAYEPLFGAKAPCVVPLKMRIAPRQNTLNQPEISFSFIGDLGSREQGKIREGRYQRSEGEAADEAEGSNDVRDFACRPQRHSEQLVSVRLFRKHPAGMPIPPVHQIRSGRSLRLLFEICLSGLGYADLLLV